MVQESRPATGFVTVEEAQTMPGLRLVVQQTVPNPWSEAAKSITYLKRIPHHRVARVSRFAGREGANAALHRWTGMDCAPIAMWGDDPPRDHWARILHLCERIAPFPPLIPSAPQDRAAMFGLCHEICDEDGFGWNRRLIFLRRSAQGPGGGIHDLERKYGAGRDLKAAYLRIGDILDLLGQALRAQAARGSPYFIGDTLSAVDVYWACFSILLLPPPQELCPLEEHVRQIYTLDQSALKVTVEPLLLQHRDHIYSTYLDLPIAV